MWFLTVFGLMCSSPAIIALSLPLAISFSTSISRSESSRLDHLRLVMRCAGRAHALQHLRRDRGGDERLSDRRRPDPLQQLGDRRVLQEVAARTGEDRVHHVCVLVGDRQHEHAGQRRDHRDLTGRLDAADPRHVEIHHDHVRRQLANGSKSVRSVDALARDLHALLLEQVAQPRAEEVVVVDEENARIDELRFGFRLGQLEPAWARGQDGEVYPQIG